MEVWHRFLLVENVILPILQLFSPTIFNLLKGGKSIKLSSIVSAVISMLAVEVDISEL